MVTLGIALGLLLFVMILALEMAPPTRIRFRGWMTRGIAVGSVVGIVTFGGALGSSLATTGCTASQLASGEATLSNIAQAANTPDACTALTAIDGTAAGQVCGAVETTVAGLAALLNNLLKSIPAKSGAKAAVIANLYTCWHVGTSATIYLRPDLVDDVKAAVTKGAAAAKPAS